MIYNGLGIRRLIESVIINQLLRFADNHNILWTNVHNTLQEGCEQQG